MPMALGASKPIGDSMVLRPESPRLNRAARGRTRKVWTRLPPVLVLVIALGLAAFATVLQVPLTAAQVVSLPAAYTSGTVPLDPVNAEWSAAVPLTIVLSAQLVQIPQGGGNVASLTARAMFNDSWFAILVEWQDATRDARTTGTSDFSDAVAVQLVSTSDGKPPYVCMGQVNFQTQVWHWKAERDLLAGGSMDIGEYYDDVYGEFYPFANESTFYPGIGSGNFLSMLNATPVQVLVAGGAGTLTSTDHRTVLGAGLWADGRWRVVFARTLAAANSDEVDIVRGVPLVIAFAAWDGANQDRNGQKSTSSWYEMPLAVPAETGGTDWIVRAVIVIAVLVALILVMRGRRRKGPRTEVPEGIITLDQIPEEPEDQGRRQFLRAGGIAAAGVAVLGANLRVAEGSEAADEEPDWPAKRRVIADEFERGYLDPDHLR